MTPAARMSAAIGVLDRILSGEAAEKALTNWGRSSRFAGSGDRAAVRDLVYDAIRCRRTYAALGGGLTGRGLILGGLRAAGTDPSGLFSGDRHAPEPLGPSDVGRPASAEESLDIPGWLIPLFEASLGSTAAKVAAAMRQRAPVFLRANLLRGSRDAALASLASDGISGKPHPLSPTAIEVTEGQRKISGASAYVHGLVELQDASSQAVVDSLPLRDGARVLDLCAGGGGKSLAIAARGHFQLFAHDAAPQRMRDIPERAKRAGTRINLVDRPETASPYDLVLVDAPCSGSGSWRRDPEGKWTLSPEGLEKTVDLQSRILDRAAQMVAPDGTLAYATCSLLSVENEEQVSRFVKRNPGWKVAFERHFSPLDGGDGFYTSHLMRV